jgi:hypothetical protein
VTRSVLRGALGALLLAAGLSGAAFGAELKVVQTQKTKDAVISLLNESGRLTGGTNRIVVEFRSPAGQPLEVRSASLEASMAMPGMSPMVAGAQLAPDKAPGRYAGTIAFEHGGTWRATVSWEGPAGRGSARFAVPVR